ncbi:FAD dependent oxidoreductase [Gonapodya prolifera JEL478]|uniref:FAD dependent oxidoreductase n=1 Tax=Gonapodya prolifera (strain JEL478) TaxID=1344416 RepID=A0A139AWC5_GONPJ|nr:FAD dependent oxidoreductase [Gonapodya prolifera JEL478]|eukprot:KXS21009.1 FAD dependent oxidoreductase [Gonapodya prolifera JEL478]
MPISPFPVPNATTSFWRAGGHPLDSHRSTVDVPPEVDIAVIGAGYAGVACVYHILDLCRTKGLPVARIVILEAREVCSGATGRNGGHLKPDPYYRPSTLAQSHGVQVAAEFASFEVANLYALKKVIETEGIDCDFVYTRAVDALMTTPICDRIKTGVELLKKHGVKVMDDVYFAKGAEAEQLSGVKGAKGCFSYTAGHLWPYKLVIGLLEKTLAAGVNLQTNTPVTHVTKDLDAAGFLTLTTPRGTVRAKKIVYATNGYTSSILPEFAAKIVPVRGICSHIRPGKSPAPLLPHSYIVRWSESEYEYLIPRLDGSIVVGGARSKYYSDLDTWYDNVEDDKLIESAKHHFDGYMQRVFKGWENTGAYTDKVWTGIMGYSTDSTPHVGRVPGRPNQFMLAGFTGHGMPQIFLSAKGVAAMVVDGADFKSTGIPRLYEATEERLNSTKNNILDGWRACQNAAVKGQT